MNHMLISTPLLLVHMFLEDIFQNSVMIVFKKIGEIFTLWYD